MQELRKRFAALSAAELLSDINSKEVLTAQEAAIYLGYNTSWLRRLASLREVPHYKKRGRLYFSRQELDDWRLSEPIKTREY